MSKKDIQTLADKLTQSEKLELLHQARVREEPPLGPVRGLLLGMLGGAFLWFIIWCVLHSPS